MITNFNLCIPGTTVVWTDQAVMSLLLSVLKPLAEKCGYQIVLSKNNEPTSADQEWLKERLDQFRQELMSSLTA